MPDCSTAGADDDRDELKVAEICLGDCIDFMDNGLAQQEFKSEWHYKKAEAIREALFQQLEELKAFNLGKILEKKQRKGRIDERANREAAEAIIRGIRNL